MRPEDIDLPCYRFDAAGEPERCTFAEFLEWSSTQPEKWSIVAQDRAGDIMVSTIFLFFDHGYGGKPRVFETMIFGGPHDQHQERYATKAEALAGHARACRLALEAFVEPLLTDQGG